MAAIKTVTSHLAEEESGQAKAGSTDDGEGCSCVWLQLAWVWRQHRRRGRGGVSSFFLRAAGADVEDDGGEQV
jgi:hypothetical protein